MQSLKEKLRKVRKEDSEVDSQENLESEDLSRTSFEDSSSGVFAGHSRNSFQEGRINYYLEMNKSGGDSTVSAQPDVVIGEDLLSSSLSDENIAENIAKNTDKKSNKNQFSLSLFSWCGCTAKSPEPKIDLNDLLDTSVTNDDVVSSL